MPYEIIVTKVFADKEADVSSEKTLFSENFGSASFVSLYWSSIAQKVGLEMLSSIGEKASSDDGFSVKGEGLGLLQQELSLLELEWNVNPNIKDKELASSLSDKMKIFKKAVLLAIENSAELSVY